MLIQKEAITLVNHLMYCR